ncbi:DUF3325 domain-containing protein [Xanthomonas hortorum pv. gardneri]|uniref:DUF3325 family protein n=1 Tax=Xanthomonas hortorum TaxID=56454 RepID=UPI002FE2F024
MGGLMTALLGTALCHAAMMALALAALVLCVLGWGGTVGTMLWLGFLSVGALLVALGLAYAPRWSAWLALLLGCAACVVIGWRAQ